MTVAYNTSFYYESLGLVDKVNMYLFLAIFVLTFAIGFVILRKLIGEKA